MTSRLRLPGMSRLGRARRYLPLVGAGLALAILAAIIVPLSMSGPSTRLVRADFVAAPGLYPGNHVDVLGIPVGTVTSVHPHPSYVEVDMQVDDNVKLPADSGAVIMAPQVVADRFVQLTPAYGGGPTLASEATIPMSRTVIPQSVDAVIGTLDNLAKQLGPTGANKNGALSAALDQLARQLRGNGPDIHQAITNFAVALHGIASAAPQLTNLLDNLGGFSTALADNANTYKAFAADLASVGTLLSSDRSDLGAVLSNLQQALGQLNDFVTHNSGTLGASLANLQTFAASLGSQQEALAKAFDIGPLSLQNLDNTIDKSAPGGPALRGRYDPVAATNGLFNTICGSSALRFLVVLASGTQTNPLTAATPVDSVCAIGNALTALTPPPGASPGPNLSLAALAGSP